MLPANQKDASIAGLWHFDGNWKDSSGNENNGIPNNGATFVAGGIEGHSNAAVLDGSNDYVRVANSQVLNITGSISVEAWIKPYNVNKRYQVIVAKNYQYWLGTDDTNGKIGFEFKNTAGGYTYVISNQTLENSKWYHIVATYDGSNAKIHINGKIDAAIPYVGNIESNNYDVLFGEQANGCFPASSCVSYDYYFSGIIGKIALYSRALSEQEIANAYDPYPKLSMSSPGQTVKYKPGETGTATVTATNPNGIVKLYCNASGAVSEGTLVVPFDLSQADVTKQFTFRVAADTAPYAPYRLSCIAETVAGTFGTSNLDLQAADVVPATVTGASIANNATGIIATLPITVTFNEAMLAVSITSDSVQLRRVDTGAVVTGTSVLSADGKTLTFTPAVALECSTSYQFLIHGVIDLVGNSSDYSINFTTQLLTSPLIENKGTSAVPYVLSGGRYGVVTVKNSYVVLDGLVVADSMTLSTNSTITHKATGLNGAERLDLVVTGALSVDVSSKIDVSGRGYLGGWQGGNNVNAGRTIGNTATGGSTSGNGGSYGGLGGVSTWTGSSSASYGNVQQPGEVGSGGGTISGNGYPGGNGGGLVKLTTGSLILNGSILANGSSPGYVNAGGGSGGGLLLAVGTLSGSGTISARGGNYPNDTNAGSGGGGRISIYYDSMTLPTANIIASGGKTYDGSVTGRNGGAGTIYLKDNAKAKADLIISNGGIATTRSTPIPGGDYRIYDVIGGAVVSAGGPITTENEIVIKDTLVTISGDYTVPRNLTLLNSTVTVSGIATIPGNLLMTTSTLSLRNNLNVTGTITAQTGSILTHEAATSSTQYGLEIKAAGLTIDSTSRIDVKGKGYLGGLQGDNGGDAGRTTGNVVDGGSAAGNGGSLGGVGGTIAGIIAASYGSVINPAELGSGGGGDLVAPASGGNGGGFVKLTAPTLTLNGSINADGMDSIAGAGSGGSIRLDVTTISGNGSITARGGNGVSAGAGGGRIALYYTSNALLNANINASGGKGGDGSVITRNGGAGTLYLKQSAKTYADLLIDNRGLDSAADSTPLKAAGKGIITVITGSSLIQGNTIWGASLLSGYWINPNISQTSFFKIQNNSTDTIFINPADGNLNSVAVVGNSFSGVYALNSLSVLGKAHLSTDEQFNVVGDAAIDNATVVAGELQAGRTLLTNGGLFERR